MRQVFIGTSAQAVGTTSEVQHFNDLASKELGVFDLDAQGGGGAFFTTQLFQTGVETGIFDTSDATDATAQALTTLGKPIMLKNRIQIAQGYGSGNPIATPIINTANITRIAVSAAAGETRHEVKVTPNTNDNTDECNLKIVVRTSPSYYLDFVNNEAAYSDLSGGSIKFPLGAFNTTNHKIINVAVTGGANEAGTCDNIKAALEANTITNALFTVSENGTDVNLKARHAGIVFDLIWENLGGTATEGTTALVNAWDAGIGNDWQVRTDELKARSYQGNFNRMYFPDSMTDFTTSGETYDKIEVTYRIDGDRAVVKGSQFGTAIIYEQASDDVINKVFNNGVAAAAGTVEYLF